MSHLFFSVLSGTIVSGNQFSLCLEMKLFLKRLFKGLLDYWRIWFYKIISSYYQNSIYIYTCKFKITIPSKAVFVTRVKADFETEHRHSKRDWNKLSCHEEKERSSSQRNIILNSRNITLLFSAIL